MKTSEGEQLTRHHMFPRQLDEKQGWKLAAAWVLQTDANYRVHKVLADVNVPSTELC